MPALIGYAAVYVFGILAPSITHSPVILNLHLLRVGVFIHFLTAIGVLALIVKWLENDDIYYSKIVAPILILLLCTFKDLLPVTPIILAVFMMTFIKERVVTNHSIVIIAVVAVCLIAFESLHNSEKLCF